MSVETAEEEDVELIAKFLAERDALCPHCAHNLRGGRAWSCPECGTPLKLVVRNAASAMMTRAWLTALLLFGACSGVVVLFVGILTVMFLSGEIVRRPSDIPPICAVVMAALHVSIMMWYLIARRGRIWLAPRRRQWMLAVSVLLVPLTTLAAGIVAAIVLGL